MMIKSLVIVYSFSLIVHVSISAENLHDSEILTVSSSTFSEDKATNLVDMTPLIDRGWGNFF